MTRMYEFIGKDLKTGEQTSVFYDGSCTLDYVAECEFENGFELDEEATLSNYLDPLTISEYYVEIINNHEIYSELSISELVDDFKLYEIIEDRFDD